MAGEIERDHAGGVGQVLELADPCLAAPTDAVDKAERLGPTSCLDVVDPQAIGRRESA